MINNTHERIVAGTPDQAWALPERLGGDNDPLWPAGPVGRSRDRWVGSRSPTCG
ncbi:hypothetical protein [Nocardiopsis sp. CC223A]|uniref:hypothetical protein n=1 Tax=Nocardiopsis sp. CC223A TaxID=3044051 RepID=UPI00278C3BEF|nr:hypothetical protein [Nocardiopsis sp. CC223A]